MPRSRTRSAPAPRRLALKSVPSTEAKNRFGEMLEHVRTEPVGIERNGRPVAVLLSRDEYDRLRALDDAHWSARAAEAAKGEFLTPQESLSLIASLAKGEAK